MAPNFGVAPPRLPAAHFGVSIASECNSDEQRITTITVQLDFALSNIYAQGQINIDGNAYSFSIAEGSAQATVTVNLAPGNYIVSGQISYFWSSSNSSIYSNWPIPNISFSALECGIMICPEIGVRHSIGSTCEANMERRANFTFNFTPMLPANQTVNIKITGLGTPQTVTFSTSAPQQTYLFSKTLPAGSYTPQFEIWYSDGSLSCTNVIKTISEFVVLPCACPDIKIKLKEPLGCISRKTPQLPVTLIADFPSNIQATNITWSIRDSKNNLIETVSGPQYREYTKTFTELDIYTVSAAVDIPHCTTSINTTTVDIRNCICPTLGPLVAAPYPSDRCTISFSTTINNPDNLPVKYQWDFGDGEILPLTDSLRMLHKYSVTGVVAASVSVSVVDGDDDPANDYNCGADTQFTEVELSCGPRVPPPPATPFDWACFITLILIILSMLAGTISFVAQCYDPEPITKSILIGIAIGGGIVGLVGIILWTIICGRNHCGWIQTIYYIFWALAFIHGLGAIGTWVYGALATVLVPCGITIAAGFAYFGTIAQLVQFIAEKVGCYTGGQWTQGP